MHNSQASTPTKATRPTTPTTMPAIAPDDIGVLEEVDAASLGVEVAVAADMRDTCVAVEVAADVPTTDRIVEPLGSTVPIAATLDPLVRAAMPVGNSE